MNRTATPAPPVRLVPRLAPVVGLVLLAPVTAEYLIGYDDSTGDPAVLLAGLAIFVPLYGCAALIIREVARRAGLGWPGIIMLAFGFGILQPGVIDQAMFNPSYRDIDYLQPMMEPTYLPGAGISVYLAMGWVVGHVIWSISVPIAVVESFVPARRTAPWLGRVGLGVAGLLFLGAAAVVVRWHVVTEEFLASAAQMIGTGAVVVVLVAGAFALGRRPRPSVARAAPGPWVVAAAVFALLNLPLMAEVVTEAAGVGSGWTVGWAGVALLAAAYAVAGLVLWRWSAMQGWGGPHRLAAAGAALVTNVIVGFLVEPLGDVGLVAKLGHNIGMAVGVAVLLAAAAARLRGRRDTEVTA